MNLQEAKKIMESGKFITHIYLLPGEYFYMQKGEIFFYSGGWGSPHTLDGLQVLDGWSENWKEYKN